VQSSVLMKKFLFLLLTLGLAGWSLSVHAHDFWMQASPYYTQPGGKVKISIHVGVDMIGDSLPNIGEWYKDFSYISHGNRHKVKGRIGDDPAGFFSTERPETAVIGYLSSPDFVELKPSKFNSYLKEEGLEKIIAKRNQLGEADKNAREHYIRCAKMLVQSGENYQGYEAELGYPLELFPLQNPYNLASNSTLSVELRFENKPVKDALIIAFTNQQPDLKQKIRTDANGKATISLNKPGEWIIKAVEMKRYPKKGAEWISYWASLTFKFGR